MMRAMALPRTSPVFLRLVSGLERLAARSPHFGQWYSRCFYARMVTHEYVCADLRPGARVLVLGSGSFPITAVELARRGCEVTAVDRDETTLTIARSVADIAGVAVTWLHADGLVLDYRGYDAVVVALHVEPKVQVLRRIISTADPQTRIAYRNPRGSLCAAYRRILPHDIGPGIHGRTIGVPGKKELIVLTKSVHPLASLEDLVDVGAGITLCDLAPNAAGTIAHAPDHPSLAALGLRPGRRCTVVTTQPWGGPVICAVGGREVALSRSIASSIRIAPLSGHS